MKQKVLIILDPDDHGLIDVVAKGSLCSYLRNHIDDPFMPQPIIDEYNKFCEHIGEVEYEYQAINIIEEAGYIVETWEVYEEEN